MSRKLRESDYWLPCHAGIGAYLPIRENAMDKPFWTVGKIRDALEAFALTHQHERVHMMTLTGANQFSLWVGGEHVGNAKCVRIGPQGVIKDD